MMGWAYGKNNEGREIGYTVKATCDLDGCEERIDRGLAYCCGGEHDGGEHGCGRYFCSTHLFYGAPEQLCGACLERAECTVCGGEGHDENGEPCSACGSEGYAIESGLS